MGNKVPVPDERMQKVMDMLRMEKKDLRRLWNKFRKYDKDRSGEIDVDEFYRMIHEKRNIFGDSIFELIDMDQNGTLDFSEFVQTLGTYCMFGRDDIRKFCFYIFDKDKNGYIEADELTALIDMLHENKVQGNCKVAMEKFDTNKDGKIDFGEFEYMDKCYPMLLFPAYRMQENMMLYTLGENWWKQRREMLADQRLKERKLSDKAREKERKRQERIRRREIQRKMGLFQYYFCPQKRAKYEVVKINPADADEDKKKGKKGKGMEMLNVKDRGEKKKKKKKKKRDKNVPQTDKDQRAEKRKKRKAEKDKVKA